MSEELDRHFHASDDSEPDVEAHRMRHRHAKANDDEQSNEPDVEAHRHRQRHFHAGDEEKGSDEPDVEAHRFV